MKPLYAICLDSFKTDYLKHMPYLSSLSPAKKLEVPFGFTASMASFFTASTPTQHKIFSLFKKSKSNNLLWTKYLSFLGRKILDKLLIAKSIFSNQLFLFHLPSPPQGDISQFEPCMKKAFEQKKSLNVKTIFERLDSKRVSYTSIDWPFVFKNHSSRLFFSSSDSSVLKKSLKAKSDFVFIHFLTLDTIAHKYGTESPELKAELINLDECLKTLSPKNYIIFSDHGMCDIEKTVDVKQNLKDLPFEYGTDYLCFYDTTIVRFWILNDSIRGKLKNELEKLSEGTVLDRLELKKYNVSYEYGDLFFVANPKTMILPNAFQKEKIAAAHGYLPEKTCQKGFVTTSLPHTPKNIADVGKAVLDYFNA